MTNIIVAENFKPRSYQLEVLKNLQSGIKRAVLVHHRRAGKDIVCFNFMIMQAVLVKQTYWYMFPEYTQARKAIWEATTNEGLSYIDFIPKELIMKINAHDMTIKLINGSIIRFVGSNPDPLRGAGIGGIVLSEYSMIAPSTWAMIEPMIVEKNGWAIFASTPRGENHFYDLYRMAKSSPDWYTSFASIKDTGAFELSYIDQIRSEGTITEDEIKQEYFCSFRGASSGAYYSLYLEQAEDANRVGRFEYNVNLPVYTAWDIGVSDATAIIIFQVNASNQVIILESFQASNEGLEYYTDRIRHLAKQHRYKLKTHFMPHDVNVREWQSGISRIEAITKLGFHVTKLPQEKNLIAGIQNARKVFKNIFINKLENQELIKALKNYKKKWCPVRRVYSDNPLHDEHSHMADAFRYLCTAYSLHFGTQYYVQKPFAIGETSNLEYAL